MKSDLLRENGKSHVTCNATQNALNDPRSLLLLSHMLLFLDTDKVAVVHDSDIM